MSFHWWQAAVLGLVEGITEYLPISSTGHLILASSLMGLDRDPELQSAVNAFNIVIQGGAILAVLGLYWRRVRQMLFGLVGRDPAGLRLAAALAVAFLPAAILGVAFNELIEQHLFFPGPVVGALVLGGIYMIVLDRVVIRRMRAEDAGREGGAEPADRAATAAAPLGPGSTGEAGSHFDPHDVTSLRMWQALFIGLMQCIAMWPGTSRSMMTITAGVLVGLRPRQAAEFSFLLGLPTLGGACVYALLKNLQETSEAGTPHMFEQLGWTGIAIGLGAATVSAALAVRWLVGFLNRHGLAPFGWYRLVLAAALAGGMSVGLVQIGPPEAEPAAMTPPADGASAVE